jgi:hypothetical protein
MTVAEGLVTMWVADALGEMCEALRQQSEGEATSTVEVEHDSDAVGRPVLRLRVGTRGAVRIQIVEEEGTP